MKKQYDDFMRRFENTGDWGENPWFLDPDFETKRGGDWERLGLPREKRVLASESLRNIFPPKIVMEMKNEPQKWFGHVASLFGGITLPSHIADLLDLGVNSELTCPWEDRSVLQRLQRRYSHYDAVFETAVHAGLVRGGAEVERVPEAPPEKRHDFNARFRGQEYEVEVKLTGSPVPRRIARELHQGLYSAVDTIPGLKLVLKGSEKLADMCLDNPEQVKDAIPKILNELAATIERIRLRGEYGDYTAGEWGRIHASPGHVHGSVEDQILPDLHSEKQASRVVRKLRDGLKQLSGNNPGVLVVGLFRSAQPDLVERLVLRNSKMASALAKKCVMVVLCESLAKWHEESMVPERIPLFYAFSPLKVRSLRPQELELARAASSTHWAQSIRMDWEMPGHISTRLSSSRPTPIIWSLGSAKWKPGETVTFSFDSLPQTRKRKGAGDANEDSDGNA